MIKVSVIIPVYNTEKYLSQCLNSILNQTLKEIEIICVNDGSTDNSGKILEAYAKIDTRIRVIHKENEGSVCARNTGIEVALGKYVGFVDSDDWIEPEMYMKLYELAEKYNVDLVSSGYFLEGNYTTVHMDTIDEGVYREKKYIDTLNQLIYRLDKKETGLRGSLCCKLFLREKVIVMQQSVPKNISIAEDKMCLLIYMLNSSAVYVYRKAFYHYRINMESVTHDANTNYLLNVNTVYQFLQNLYLHPKFTSEMRKQAEIYITELLIMGINTRLGFENRNMLWIDPYWLEKLPENSKIVLYGAGELGRKYKRHLNFRKDCIYVACVDPNYQKITTEEFPVLSVERLLELDYNYVVITIKNSAKAIEVKETLKNIIPEEKILWFEQPEIFWKYVEADSLL